MAGPGNAGLGQGNALCGARLCRRALPVVLLEGGCAWEGVRSGVRSNGRSDGRHAQRGAAADVEHLAGDEAVVGRQEEQRGARQGWADMSAPGDAEAYRQASLGKVQAEQMVTSLPHPLLGSYRGITRPIVFGRTPGPEPFAAPVFDQDAEHVLGAPSPQARTAG